MGWGLVRAGLPHPLHRLLRPRTPSPPQPPQPPRAPVCLTCFRQTMPDSRAGSRFYNPPRSLPGHASLPVGNPEHAHSVPAFSAPFPEISKVSRHLAPGVHSLWIKMLITYFQIRFQIIVFIDFCHMTTIRLSR